MNPFYPLNVEYAPPTTEETRDENGNVTGTLTKWRPLLTDEERKQIIEDVVAASTNRISARGRGKKTEDIYFPPIILEYCDLDGKVKCTSKVYRPILTDAERAKREKQIMDTLESVIRGEQRRKWLEEHQAQE